MMKKALATSPPVVRFSIVTVLVLLMALAVNWFYHAIKKPTELCVPATVTVP